MFSLGFLTLDLIIIFAIALLFFFISISKGSGILVKLILSTYISILIFSNLPWVIFDNNIATIGVFILIIAIVFFLIKVIRLKRISSKSSKFFDSILLSVASLITVLILYFNVLPIDSLYSLSIPFENVFTQVVPLGVWYFVPIIVIFFVARKEGE